MGDKLTHRQHKVILILVVLASLIIGAWLGSMIQNANERNGLLLILTFGVAFTAVVLIIITLSILVRLEEDFYWYKKKL